MLETIKTFEGTFFLIIRRRLQRSQETPGRGFLTLTDRQGVRQMLVILPIIEGAMVPRRDMVPVDVLRSSYIQSNMGYHDYHCGLPCSLFIWLMSRQRKMAVKIIRRC